MQTVRMGLDMNVKPRRKTRGEDLEPQSWMGSLGRVLEGEEQSGVKDP